MISADVVVAGGGISGLLIASALAPHCSVVLLEQAAQIPQTKYWLTNEKVVKDNPQFSSCINRTYDFMDFIASDLTTARVQGRYCIWDTGKLIQQLVDELEKYHATLHVGHRLYSISSTRTEIVIRANTQAIHARLLVDCMGFGSPLVGAHDIATIKGYYIVHGREVALKHDVPPIALDNVVVNRRPAYFELFPTAQNTAHASIILPARHHKPDISLPAELSFILQKSHYSKSICQDVGSVAKTYFGIVPVGRLRTNALNRIAFFGEAAQANPAASATALTRMLATYKGVAAGLLACLENDKLDGKSLRRAMPAAMSRMNRVFHETLFESLLSFTSNDFLRLVEEMRRYPNSATNDLIFADFEFLTSTTARLAVEGLLRPRAVLGWHVLKSLGRVCGIG